MRPWLPGLFLELRASRPEGELARPLYLPPRCCPRPTALPRGGGPGGAGGASPLRGTRLKRRRVTWHPLRLLLPESQAAFVFSAGCGRGPRGGPLMSEQSCRREAGPGPGSEQPGWKPGPSPGLVPPVRCQPQAQTVFSPPYECDVGTAKKLGRRSSGKGRGEEAAAHLAV